MEPSHAWAIPPSPFAPMQTPRMALVKPLRAVMEPQAAPMTSKLEQKLKKAQMKLEKAQMKFSMAAAEARGTLYMLHWHSVAPSSVVAEAKAGEKSCSMQTQAYITKLQDDLKRMEAVSKVRVRAPLPFCTPPILPPRLVMTPFSPHAWR
jgi:hypothetical protein